MNKFLKPLAGPNTEQLTNIIGTINTVISAGLGVITTGVIILAIFIAIKFFTADDKDKRANAKSQLIYCIIGIIVLLAMIILAPQITNAIKNAMTDNNI